MDSRALSPLIGFVLLLSIIMGFMSIMQSNAVPQWNKGAEAKHLDKVSYEVAKLSEAVSIAGSTGNPAKIVIDAGVKYPEYYILISPSKAAGSIDKRELWVKIGTENFTTHAIIYRPNYLYSSSPELIFEHSAIFRMEHSYLIVISDQSSFTRNKITIYLINATFNSFSITENINLIFHPISYGGSTRFSGTLEFLCYDDRTALWWNDTLSAIYGSDKVSKDGRKITLNVNDVDLSINYFVVTATSAGEVEITSEITPSRLLNLSSLSYGVYAGTTIPLGVRVLDKFNNPVRNVAVSIQDSCHSSATKNTNDNGEVWYYFNADIAGTCEVEFSVDGVDEIRYSVTVSPAPGGGGGGIFNVFWNISSYNWNVSLEGIQKFFEVSVWYGSNPVEGAVVDISTDAPGLISYYPISLTTSSDGKGVVRVTTLNNGTANLFATCGGSGDVLELIITGAGGYCSAGWRYWREITITNTGSALTDYQINVTLNTQSLISSGKMRSDCGDIRFIDENFNPLSYWIEDGTCNKPNTEIWVKIPSIPASGTVNIYMLYGNPSASSESNIDSVMDSGLRYYYYDGTNFDTFKGTDVDTYINHDWGSGLVVINGNSWEDQSDTVSIRWEGWIKPAGNGNHRIFVYTDDGSRLWIGGTLVIDKWYLQAPTEHSGNYNFHNQIKRIKYEWYENTGLAVAKLGWDPPGGNKVYPIPADYLKCRKTTFPNPEPSVSVGDENTC